MKSTRMLPLLYLFISITCVVAENCSHIYDGKLYSKREILNINGLPTNLIYNPITKDLHFTLIDIDTLQNDSVQTKMDQYILKDDGLLKIENINGQAAAVDVKNERVYIASDKGLHILNSTNKANLVTMENDDIVQVYKPKAGDDLYLVTFPDSEVYKLNLITYEKRRIENVPCAFILIVDEADNIFYECDSKYVKMLLKGFQEPIEFVGIPKNSARALAVDNNRVILAANDGLYWLKTDSIIPTKLMYLDFVPSGIAMGDENIYLSTSGKIYEYSTEHCNEE